MRINEIFYSLQGEGYRCGIPSVFVRFSGCNLACDFCDTDHLNAVEMSDRDILAEIDRFAAGNVVLTGGEPSLQLTEGFVRMLKDAGKFIQIETNGSVDLPGQVVSLIDWITCSPKSAQIRLSRIDELKVVFNGAHPGLDDFLALASKHGAVAMLQPCDIGNVEDNRNITAQAIDYIKENPGWRLSLQTHKMLSIR